MQAALLSQSKPVPVKQKPTASFKEQVATLQPIIELYLNLTQLDILRMLNNKQLREQLRVRCWRECNLSLLFNFKN